MFQHFLWSVLLFCARRSAERGGGGEEDAFVGTYNESMGKESTDAELMPQVYHPVPVSI